MPTLKFASILSLGCAVLLSNCADAPKNINPWRSPLSAPQNNQIVIDGDLRDWQAKDGYSEIKLFANDNGLTSDPESFLPRVYTAWNNEGLLLAFDVHDDYLSELPEGQLWLGDCIVIHYSKNSDQDDRILFMLTPGLSNGLDRPRTLLRDNRKDAALTSIVFEPRYARQKTATGYNVEILLPFAAMGIVPEVGSQVGVQIAVKDRDIAGFQNELMWRPKNGQIHEILLANSPETRAQVAVKSRIVDREYAEILVFADAENAYAPITVQSPGISSQTAQLKPAKDFSGQSIAKATFSIPYQPSIDKDPSPLIVGIFHNDREIATLNIAESAWVDSQNSYRNIASVSAMKAFERDRLENNYSENAILAIGSSSMRLWTSIHEDLKGYEIIHRGFGGSTMQDVLDSYQFLVTPYQAKTFLIYEGDNDLVKGTGDEFYRNWHTFIKRVKRDRPGAQIFFISPKPSIQRWHLHELYQAERERLKAYAATDPQVHYIDVTTPMLDENGVVLQDIFEADNLHLNEKGYALWSEAIFKALQKFQPLD
jgi:lysophospholipase L1-like esterase